MSYVKVWFFSRLVTYNGLQLKEVRYWNTLLSTDTMFISCRNTVLFFAYIKITNFREATNCRQKTYTSARIFFRCCYKLPAAFSEKSTNETKCFVTSNVSNRSRIPPVAIWKIAGAWDRFTSFFAKFGLQGWFVRFANGLGNLMRLSTVNVEFEK